MKSSFLQNLSWKEENIDPNWGSDNAIHFTQDIQIFLPSVRWWLSSLLRL